MTTKTRFSKKLLSIVLCIALLMSYIPAMLTASADEPTNPYYNRIVDANTMDGWKDYFDLDNLDTSNAGGVWTDKSVFTDVSAFPDNITMIDDGKNFLTALSAIAANKEVVGYSTIPTDTVLILDLSGSMENSDSEQDLIDAANNAIQKLLKINNNNRVGVVLYSASGSTGSSTYDQSVTRILPIDRYTTGLDNKYLNLSGDTVSVDIDVEGTSANADLNNTKNFGGGTYIQAGLWEAMKMFEEMDTVIAENNWQSGESRMPIVVLMSDGAPSTGTSYYDDVENSQYTSRRNTVKGSNVGNGNEQNLTAGNAFLTQLTASYVMNRIKAHYQAEDANVRGLFYTLGFNIGNNSVAQSVMNPENSTFTDDLWKSYNTLTTGTLSVRVKNRSGDFSDVAIYKNSYATSKAYVNEYFSASNNGLSTAFDDIVDEIILQSRYYPTHLEGGSPDFSGYVTFEDKIGEYMEVKDIKGILLGDTLFDGHKMASKFLDTTEDGLGSVTDPTDLGDEFIRSIKTRLGIADTVDAQLLVQRAWNAKQLYYDAATGEWSNNIGWYAKADGTYAGFWDENSTAQAPEDAVYKIKSFSFLGETTGSIKNSDMMYMTVRIRTDIATGEQSVVWKIPASLVPMITYLVTLDGTNVDNASQVSVSVDDKEDVSPIRLVFETGLRSDLNEFNITRITNEKHLDTDGHTRLFWNNYFDISSASHEDHVTTMTEFTPSMENERFYFTFDSAVHKKAGDGYVLVGENETLDENGEYFHRRYIFKQGESKPIFFYEKMSSASIKVAKDNGWDKDFETLDGKVGAWVVPAGTPARELQMYSKLKAQDLTQSAHMVFYPYLSEQNNTVYVDMNLGNNGLLAVTPAQGIKLSKTIDIYETGTSDTFKFRITAQTSGTFDGWITALDETPSGEATKVTLTNGIYEVELKKDQSFWLVGLPAGVAYTIEEISDNADYKVKSVHVNGNSTGTVGTGVVAAYQIDDVDFVNTALGEGDLVITKKVVDANGNTVDISDNVKFTAEITLEDASGNAVYGTFPASNAEGYVTVDSNGKFEVTLSEGESFIVRDIPEETEYTVKETNIPAGFSFNASASRMNGVVDSTANDQALIVNTYEPTSATGNDINVIINKQISGNRTEWQNGESYSFTVERIDLARATGTVVETATISYNDATKSYSFTLADQSFSAEGSYYFKVTETEGDIGGITYDLAERRFRVDVADTDRDGDLEIVSVVNEVNTVVSGSYTVTADFNNVYAPTGSATATIEIVKEFVSDTHSLSGYQFALYDADPSQNTEANEVIRSTVTGADGIANINLTYAANRATMQGTVYTYYLAEINRGELINNIRYSNAVYKVEVTVKDNGDGTVSAYTLISGIEAGDTSPTFTNEYVPSASDFVTVSGKKKIVGDRALNAGEFEFEIKAVTAGAPMPATATVKNAADGSFSFPAIEFTDAHKGQTFVYEVAELKTKIIGGFRYDDRVYTVTVTVTDNGTTVTATSVITLPNSSASDIVFENEYIATPAEVEIDGTKLLTGKTMQAGEFTFIIDRFTENAPMPFSDANTNSATNDANGNIDFGTFVFDKKGTYVYTIYEKDLRDDRYDCDKSVYTMTVTVTDNSEGVLSAKVELAKDGMSSTEIVFRNGFVPTPIDYDIYENFGGKKNLVGRDLANGEFEFKLINAINGQQIGETVKNAADGTFKFPAVTLPDAGTYHFKITEVVGDKKGVSYDTASFHVLVVVEKDDDGKLSIVRNELHVGKVVKEEVGGILTEVTNYELGTEIAFNNTYKAASVDVTLEATKKLEGRDLLNGEFKFDLYNADENFVKGTVAQNDIVNNGNKVTFATITFDTAGDRYYVIVEDEKDENGITADKTEQKVHVKVTDNLEGNLTAEIYVNGSKIADAVADSIIFTNKYKAAEVKVGLVGTKVLSGRDLEDGEFKFDIYNADQAFAKGTVAENDVALVLQQDGTGKITFADLTFDKTGTYYYVIVEDELDENGITADKTEYKISIEVTDAGLGQLAAKIKVNGEEITGSTADAVKFVNKYKAAETKVALTGKKILSGRDLLDGEFKFDLYNADDKYVKGTVAQNDVVLALQADGTGKITFADLTFDKTGTYYYVIVEDEKDENGITVDKTEHKIKIVVTDEGIGQLEAKVYVDDTEITGSTIEAIKFSNLYAAAPAVISIKGNKQLGGRDLVENEFSFELYDKDGKLIETVKNTAKGDIFFTDIDVDKAGEYTFTVKEIKGNAEGITYDTTVYTVKVTVKDNLDGTMSVEYIYSTDKGNSETLTFVNKYTAPTQEPEIPQTGDSQALWMWMALAFVSILGVFTTGFFALRKSEEN